MDYFLDNHQQLTMNYKPAHSINSNVQNNMSMETDRRLSNTENDEKIRDQQFRMMLALIIRKMEDRDEFYIRSQFRDRVGDIADNSENAVLELFDLLITYDIISSSNCKQLVDALIDINRPDLANILQDDEKTRNKQKTSPNSFIKSSSLDTAFEARVREQTKHTLVPREQPSGYKHRSELAFNLNSRGNSVNFKGDRLNECKTDDTLTDDLVLRVCEELTPSDFYILGVKGFGLGMSQVIQAKHDARSALDAAIFIFLLWKNEAPLNSYERAMGSSTIPEYSRSGLKIALKAANLNHLAYQINRPDLANILQDDEKTRNKRKTSPNSFIKSSSFETEFETPRTREQPKHKLITREPSGYKHRSELAFNLNSIGNLVKFKGDRLNVYKTDDTLTDDLVLRVCEELTPSDWHNLGVIGFGLRMSQVTRAKHDARSALDAAISLFHQWRNEAPLNSYERLMGSTMPVYSKSGLKTALKAANLNYLAYKFFP